jgi:hypothetical protein
MQVVTKKDWEWYLAEVNWIDYLYAYWFSKQEAENELLNVIDMIMDYEIEQLWKQRQVKEYILNK